MNKVVYGDSVFTDSELMSAEVTLSNSMVADSLAADEFNFSVHVDEDQYLRTLEEQYTIASNRPESFIYGTQVQYYKDDKLQGKFYLESGKRIGRDIYEFKCISAIGLLIRIPHEGGVYESSDTTIGELIVAIFDRINFVEGVDYTIEQEVASLPVNGWLPYSNCRDNLRQILFAVGASIVKSDDGNYITIKFISSPTLTDIPTARIYEGGKVEYLSSVSQVEVWEHEYHKFATDEEAVLFDNTGKSTADNDLIIFKDPCHTLSTTGTLTFYDNGANYAIVSGEGSLIGKKYTHTTKVVVESISGLVEDKVVEVKDATLITSLNSYNAACRIAEYYKATKEVRCGIVLAEDGLKPSSKVAFTNPYGEADTGYIKSMDITVSKINKSDTVIATNWTPKFFGNSFVESTLIEEGSTWVAPKTGRVRFVLIGGGAGGQGGGKGTGGDAGEFSFGQVTLANLLLRPIKHGKGGTGGIEGIGGEQGKVLIIDVDVVEGQSYAIQIGQGGAGGARNGGTGQEGTATTITINGRTYSSANGIIYDNGYVDPFNGDVYAVRGWDGVAGLDANQNKYARNSTAVKKIQVQVSESEFKEFSVRPGHPSTTGGLGFWRPDGLFFEAYAYDGDGGAGAFAYPITQGSDSSDPYEEEISGGRFSYSGGEGGAGANAINLQEYIDSEYNTEHLTLHLKPGTGGVGGNGGGGGGGGGGAAMALILPEATAGPGYGGIGGMGSRGVNGANGGILVYV